MKTITRRQFYETVKKSNGKFFSVQFVKRTNGELRNMTCRINVKKHLAGGDRAYDPDAHRLIFVYDMIKEGYRAIPIEGVKVFKYGGQTYKVV